MKRITIALILFQLIGCAKQPVVTTRPENKQEQEQKTPQGDTPQAPKTNYLKIGAYTGGVILTILASIGLIAYCCRQKEEEILICDDPLEEIRKKRAEKRTKQDKADIDIIVPKAAKAIQTNHPAIGDCLQKVYTKHRKYDGKMGLEAILRWYVLQAPPKEWKPEPGQTILMRNRQYVKYKIKTEITKARMANQGRRISELFTIIESKKGCFLNFLNDNLRREEQCLRMEEMDAAPDAMNTIVRIIYYYEFKNALIENER